ncbi:MAG TPA: DUF1304 domain-containing protein [Herpetosiphonaceae bacterium]
MQLVANGLVGLVALIHGYIVLLEMVWWNTPRGWRIFGMTPEQAEATKVLAANQGLYNGFLAAGLVWGLILGEAGYGAKLFFLGCVAVAGVFGAVTTGNRRILFVQTVPAVLAALLLILAR